MARNIEMNYKEADNYEVLYPQVQVENVIDITEHYYTKTEIEGQISDIIPNPYGVLAIKATDDEGNPVSVQLTVNPQVDGSSTITTDSGSGLFVAFVNPATYNLTAPAGSDFIEYNIDVPSAQVKTNQVTNVNVGVNVVQSGELEITSSRTIQFPANFNIPVDIWGCGGGASGAVWKSYDQGGTNVGGGGGGYTKMITNIDLQGETLEITLGSGGSPVSYLWNDYQGKIGNNGGNTVVKRGSSDILSVNGGECGYYGGSSFTYTGGDGGSGGGGAAGGTDNTNEMFNGAEDGASAYRGNGVYGGIGQGTTTRIFGDSSREPLCSGGGGAACNSDRTTSRRYIYYGQGGKGAGAGYALQLFSNDIDISTPSSVNATSYGSGGGGASASYQNGDNTAPDGELYSGSGKQGVVFIRWPSQA